MNELFAENYAKKQLRLRSYAGLGMTTVFAVFALFIAPGLSKDFSKSTVADSFPTFLTTANNLVAAKKPAVEKPIKTLAATPAHAGRESVLAAVQHEYSKRPREYDAIVLTYTEGMREEWCADFVSYIYKQAGQPLVNPHNGSWRIPAVVNMQRYFESEGRYRSAYTYTPQPGDVAIYGGRHTNIVVAVDGDTMTTIGGNEYDTVYKDSISHAMGARGLTGFGIPLE